MTESKRPRRMRPDNWAEKAARPSTLLDRLGERLDMVQVDARERIKVERAILYRLFVLGESQRTVAAWCRGRGGEFVMSEKQVRRIAEEAKRSAESDDE